MSYVGPFERAFMKHTLEIVRRYRGEFDATLLLNCLLVLLIVPRETCLSIPEAPISDLPKWGISPRSIHDFGNRTNADTLRGLVHSLRNSVAHFRFNPVPQHGDVTGLHFHDANGFKATINFEEMRVFVERLSEHIHSS